MRFSANGCAISYVLTLDRELAVKAEIVQGVERLVDVTPVPNVAPWIKGVINLARFYCRLWWICAVFLGYGAITIQAANTLTVGTI